jgi:uncharacterized Fe-S cluster-containing protein
MESLEERVKQKLFVEYRMRARCEKTRNEEYKEALLKIRRENKIAEVELFIQQNRNNTYKQDYTNKLNEIEGLKLQLKFEPNAKPPLNPALG